MPATICSQCGSPNQSGGRFCGTCGAAAEAPRTSPQVSSSSMPAGAAKILRVGRDPANEIVLSDATVSARHARVIVQDGRGFVEDLGSRNGTAINAPVNRIGQAEFGAGDTLWFGSVALPGSQFLGGNAPAPKTRPSQLQHRIEFKGDTMVLGRDPRCEVQLEDPTISRRHAALIRRQGRVFVQDLGSSNGTYVNGRRIQGEVATNPGDTIALGAYSFQVSATGAVQQTSYKGDVAIEVRDLAVNAGGRRLIEGISFTINPGELVGLMGPSGSGKTTLMSAINGYQPPASGTAWFNGLDLYANYDRFRHQMGYVPQDDIMHGELTVYQALYYTARLRLPSDYTDADIRARIADVLAKLGLGGTENVLIGSPDKKGISGGQRKRVNIAMELLTDPSVLFLDEPTSGLSSQDALMVMKVIRDLADSGKTILLTIHQPSVDVFELMHLLVVLGKDPGGAEPGRLAYFGPAYPDSIHFFHPGGRRRRADREPSPDEVLEGLSQQPAAYWSERFVHSPFYREYVYERANQAPAAEASPPRSRESGSQASLRQWWTLVRRIVTLKKANTRGTILYLAQPLLIGLLLIGVFSEGLGRSVSDLCNQLLAEHKDVPWREFTGQLGAHQFLLIMAAIWFGCNNSAKEIVGEWAIYRRERMVNLRIPSYLLSKYAVLGFVCLMQCVILLAVAYPASKLQGPWGLMLAIQWGSSMVGVGLGLLISTLANTTEAAVNMTPLVLLPLIIFGGVLKPVHQLPNDAMRGIAAMMASRWGFEGMLTLEAEHKEDCGGHDLGEHHFPKAERNRYSTDVLVLGGMFTAFAASAAIMLRRRDIHRRSSP